MTETPSRSSVIRRVLIAELLVLLILGAAGLGFMALAAQKPELAERDAGPTLLNVEVFDIESVTVREVLSGFGSAVADVEVIVAAQVPGEITAVHPDLKVGVLFEGGGTQISSEGLSSRTSGELLVRIDSRDYDQRVAVAQTQIQEATSTIAQLKQQVENAERQLANAREDLRLQQEELARIRAAFERNAGLRSDLTRAQLDARRYEDIVIQLEDQLRLLPLQVSAAEDRRAAAEAESERAKNDRDRTVIRPPFTGIVTEVMAEQGQFVTAGQPLFRLTSPDRVEVPIALSLSDYLQIEKRLTSGAHVNVALAENETSPDRWTGVITRPAPEADAASRTVRLFVEVDNTTQAEPLLPGTFVFARVDAQEHADVLLIPRDCIRNREVFVVDNEGKARARKVSIERKLQSMAIVSGDLSGGDQILMTNLDIVQDGRDLTVQSSTNAAGEIQRLRSPQLRLVESAK